MRRFLTDIAGVLMLAIFFGGIAAVIAVPGDAASKTALGLAVFAALLAAANYATSPDWDEIAKDIRGIRQAAEEGLRSVTASTHSPSKGSRLAQAVVGIALIAAWFGRRAARD